MFKNRKIRALAAIVAIAMPTVVTAQPLSYPGSMWNTAQYGTGFKQADENNALFSGNIEQGIVWTNVGEWQLNTYAALSYSTDRDGYSWNNKAQPGIGIKLQRNIGASSIEVGLQASYAYRWKEEKNKNASGLTLYVSTWNGWNLK